MSIFLSAFDLVCDVDRVFLQKPFSEDEIKDVVMGSYAHGVLGPDGLSLPFYRTFWDLIKK